MYESLVLFSEFILSAYPILIKKVHASLFLQTGFRMFVFAILAIIGAIITRSPIHGSAQQILTTGALNLAHVGCSYSAFASLPAGNAMALFYTYPIWNAIAASLTFHETITVKSWIWIVVALIGALLVAKPSSGSWSTWGVSMALLAALTETGIYLWFRRESKDTKQPWTDMATMYGGSGILWIFLIPFFLSTTVFQTSVSGLSAMVAFNTFVGFLGYSLRFFAIPSISTVTFSSLSFVGVIAAYLLGWLFMGEVPSLVQGFGAALIAIANIVLINKD